MRMIIVHRLGDQRAVHLNADHVVTVEERIPGLDATELATLVNLEGGQLWVKESLDEVLALITAPGPPIATLTG